MAFVQADLMIPFMFYGNLKDCCLSPVEQLIGFNPQWTSWSLLLINYCGCPVLSIGIFTSFSSDIALFHLAIWTYFPKVLYWNDSTVDKNKCLWFCKVTFYYIYLYIISYYITWQDMVHEVEESAPTVWLNNYTHTHTHTHMNLYLESFLTFFGLGRKNGLLLAVPANTFSNAYPVTGGRCVRWGGH